MPDPFTVPEVSRAGLCVVGSFMMDLIAYAERQPRPGETLIGYDFVQAPGGKGFNQALAAARAGAPTSMLGRLGTDSFGDEFLAALGAEGIDCSGVIRDEKTGTGVGHPTVARDGQNAIVVVPRSNSSLTPDDIREHRCAITSAGVMLLQLELPMPAVLEAARIAHEAGTLVILNPAPFSPLPDELLDLCDVIVPNEVELAQWAGRRPADDGQVAELAQNLADDHGLTVIVTIGDRGSLICAPMSPITRVGAHHVTAVDTVGAGDTFCGHLAALLSMGSALPRAIGRASAAAAITVTRRGGNASPTTAETDDFLAKAGQGPTPLLTTARTSS
ncbi:Ribokinase [Acidipropionibacterium acidipropionici ATCC 4875]|uniref:Deoxyribokinase n=1 Tax=Acidipropionibacterium acidipropionici (strain ATCC 4875 / DSM 20272 / JCM 6432 / NBRC 12425 / NCIMB 8070 / 4) TaxID=1171373 RepID=K7S0E9_ACIA4|nr:ribokinase [Acidipropionibacterium acidipropionici]AFV90783.1 Ribokinase [Acidipropionibacterium acidipropionici ATCC 4875]ALN15065.1 carbohydrate kinase [Acidipropionibacterium acidipropionici]APZ09184.1 ribokinase [Acidipropionibacterium acidipropionici]MDN6555182.1 ribokinase [Acidipropionibacterium acidipropionici]